MAQSAADAAGQSLADYLLQFASARFLPAYDGLHIIGHTANGQDVRLTVNEQLKPMQAAAMIEEILTLMEENGFTTATEVLTLLFPQDGQIRTDFSVLRS